MAESLQSKLQNKDKFLRTTVTLALVAGGAYALYLWGQVVPFLIEAAANTLYLVALLAVLGLITWAFLDKKTRAYAGIIYANCLRWVFSKFTDIDLIGTLKTVSRRMKDKMEEVDKAIGILRGQKEELGNSIEENEHERTDALKRMEAAQKMAARAPSMQGRVLLEGNRAGRLKASNVDLQKLLIQITSLHDGFVKRREAMDLKIQDIDDNIKNQEKRRKSLLAGYKAMQAAQGVLGDSIDQDVYNDTLEKLADESSQMLGEIETFMDMSKKINDGIDLQNMVFQEDAMADLDAWQKSKGNVRVDSKVVESATQGSQDFDSLFEGNENNKQNRA